MYVVIFRATARQLDEEYSRVAAQLRELALSRFGCLEFVAVNEGGQEVALSYWPDLDSIGAWKANADHLLAQQLGRERWYAGYRVQIAQVLRDYTFPAAVGEQP